MTRIQALLRTASLPSVLAASLATSSVSAAQTDPDSLDVIPLDSVTVTVFRTPLEVREVPYAVGVNGRAEIQRGRPGLGLDEALRGIPGVEVDNRHNYALGERISIRGFGARSQFGVRGIKVLVDGIPATLPDGQTALSHVDVGFLRRAEVIRGPAASLYGNAAGGVIHLETELPPAAGTAQEAGVVTGSDGLLRGHGTTSGRSGRSSYLLNLSRLGYEGYREFNSARSLYLNGRLGWEGEGTTLRLIGSAVDYEAQNPGGLSRELLEEDRLQAFARNLSQRTGETGRQGQLGATVVRTAGPGEVELMGYALRRTIENPIPPAVIDLDRTAGGVRVLYRTAPVQGLRWTVGAEADRQWDDRKNFANRAGERGDLSLDQFETVTNAAGFAQIAATVLRGVDLLSGVRYDRFHFRADDRLAGPTDPDDSGTRTMAALSPSIGLSVALGEAVRLYGNVATAFETPTTTELANRPEGAGGFNPELQPQRTASVEIGTKGRFAGTFAYELAAYRAGIENALIPFQVPGAEGRDFFRNAGSARHQGIEASASLGITPGGWIRLAYTYTDARFRDYVVDQEAFDGNRVPGIAPHRTALIVSHTAAAGWFAVGEGRHVSAMPVNDENTAESPAYTVVDLRGGIERLRLGAVRVEPFVGVNNVFDAAYNTSVIVNAFGGRYYEPGPGRQLHVGVNAFLR